METYPSKFSAEKVRLNECLRSGYGKKESWRNLWRKRITDKRSSDSLSDHFTRRSNNQFIVTYKQCQWTSDFHQFRWSSVAQKVQAVDAQFIELLVALVNGTSYRACLLNCSPQSCTCSVVSSLLFSLVRLFASSAAHVLAHSRSRAVILLLISLTGLSAGFLICSCAYTPLPECLCSIARLLAHWCAVNTVSSVSSVNFRHFLSKVQ